MKEPVKDKEPEIKFEKALAELRALVDKLEGGDLELDDSLKLFERGVKLIQVCSKRLDDAQRRVDIVMKSKDGKKVLREFDEETGEAGDTLPALDAEDESEK